MNTKLTDAENEVETRLVRALWAACMGSAHLIQLWRLKGETAIAGKKTLSDFVASCHPSDKRKAKAAYVLAAFEVLL